MFSAKCPFCTRRPFWAATRRPNILNFFWKFEGVAKKQGKTSVFWLSNVVVFFLSIVSSWSPVVLTNLLACKCVIHRWCLTFHVMFSFFPVVVFPCFYSSLFFLGSYFFIWLFVFLVFSIGGTETQMKPQNISKFSLSSSASVPASPHFHLARIITRLGQQKNLSKNLFFCCLYAWSISNVLKYLFLLCFYTSSKCCLQNGPQEKR